MSLAKGEGEERWRDIGTAANPLCPFWGICHHCCCQPCAAKLPGKGILLPSLRELEWAAETLLWSSITSPWQTLVQERLTRGRRMKTLGSHTPNQRPSLNILTKPIELAQTPPPPPPELPKGNETTLLSL